MWHYHKVTPCASSKDKWDTKELRQTVRKSMSHFNALYIVHYIKRHLFGYSNIKQ